MKLINDLPDDCLRHIFHQLPLSDRICLHRVCPRWRSLQSSVTDSTKSLTLNIAITEQRSKTFLERSPLTIVYLDRIDPSTKSSFNDCPFLTFPTLTENITAQLSTLLPNIEALQLNIKLNNEVSNLSFVNQLLSFWSGKLVTFEFNDTSDEPIERQLDSGVIVEESQMIEYTPDVHCVQEIFTMFRVLNHECLALQNLSFYVMERLTSGGNIDLSCLERLKTFRFQSLFDNFEDLFHSLGRYAVGNEALNHIQIENTMDMDSYQYYSVRELPLYGFVRYPALIPKFNSLSSVNPTRTLLSKFTNLTKLSLKLKDFLEMTSELEKLTNLVYLSLRILMRNTIQQYEETHPLNPNFSRLPTVKILCLACPSNTELKFDHWAWIFPSIQLVRFEQDDNITASIQDLTWIESVKQILQPIKSQCLTLKWIIMRAHCRDENNVFCSVTKELGIEEM